MMIDPKRVELSIYDGIPHLLAPVVTDSKKAAGYLKWVVEEMENRYKLFQMAGTRNISQYNDMIAKGKVQQFIPDDEEIEPLDGTSDEEAEDQIGEEAVQKQKAQNLKPLPYIVVILDELADLMMVAAGEIEDAICRAGLHGQGRGNSLDTGHTEAFGGRRDWNHQSQHTVKDSLLPCHPRWIPESSSILQELSCLWEKETCSSIP